MKHAWWNELIQASKNSLSRELAWNNWFFCHLRFRREDSFLGLGVFLGKQLRIRRPDEWRTMNTMRETERWERDDTKGKVWNDTTSYTPTQTEEKRTDTRTRATDRDSKFTDRATIVAKHTVDTCVDIIKLILFVSYYCADAKVVDRPNNKFSFYFIENFTQKS